MAVLVERPPGWTARGKMRPDNRCWIVCIATRITASAAEKSFQKDGRSATNVNAKVVDAGMKDPISLDLLERNGFETEAQVKETIQAAFPRIRLFQTRKVQAFELEKALHLLQTYLSTQDVDRMIAWAYEP